MQTKILVTAFGLALAAAALPVSAATDTSNAQNPPGSESTATGGPLAKGEPGRDASRSPNDFSAMDSNHDGKVSRAEYRKYYEGNWDRMDSGKTGSLTSQQYQDWYQKEMNRSDGSKAPMDQQSRSK